MANSIPIKSELGPVFPGFDTYFDTIQKHTHTHIFKGSRAVFPGHVFCLHLVHVDLNVIIRVFTHTPRHWPTEVGRLEKQMSLIFTQKLKRSVNDHKTRTTHYTLVHVDLSLFVIIYFLSTRTLENDTQTGMHQCKIGSPESQYQADEIGGRL